ncbi:hypothetical protein EDB87DRAFT_1122067 [Lactarius vividus]|nr:hypothetical protein EDB87DRAFT_1122067 [Lactarius vividus]
MINHDGKFCVTGSTSRQAASAGLRPHQFGAITFDAFHINSPLFFTSSTTYSSMYRQTQPGDREFPPWFVPNHGEPNFDDGFGHIFLMYWEMAGEADKKIVEGWKADADRILIFVDRFILFHRHNTNCGVHSGRSTRPTGQHRLSPLKYLSPSC